MLQKAKIMLYNHNMKSLREIIPQNIVALRKKMGLTQVGLAKKVNFSDKAVSRWEKGEVLPDIETLESLSKVFNVPFSYLIEEHFETKIEKSVGLTKNEILMHALTILIIWTIATIIFVYREITFNHVMWQLFIWAIPVTAVYMLYTNRKAKNKVINLIFRTLFCWSLLTCVYFQFLELNAWLIYIVGVPVQAAIIVSFFANPKFKA